MIQLPPCYIKTKDVTFVATYYGLPWVVREKMINFSKVENMNWRKNWVQATSSPFYIEKGMEEWILFNMRHWG